MHKVLKEHPKKSITAVLSLITALSTGGYTGYESISNIATKNYVNYKFEETNIKIVRNEIQRFESDLMRIAFLEDTGKLKTVDRLLKTKAEQRLIHLRAELIELRKVHNK